MQWRPSTLQWMRAEMGPAAPHRLRSTEPARLKGFITDRYDGALCPLALTKKFRLEKSETYKPP